MDHFQDNGTIKIGFANRYSVIIQKSGLGSIVTHGKGFYNPEVSIRHLTYWVAGLCCMIELLDEKI